MEDITYHRVTENDIQILVETRVRFLLELFGEQSPERIEELENSLNSYFTQSIKNEQYICFLARHDNVFVGVGGMLIREQPGNFKNPIGKVGYIMNMYTTHSYRRKGICSAILERLESAGREKGISAFELHATKEGEPVYVQHDFKIHSEPTYRKYVTALPPSK